LKAEEERAKKERETATKCSDRRVGPPIGVDVGDAVIPVDDHISMSGLLLVTKIIQS
jgi:hypothetical protein